MKNMTHLNTLVAGLFALGLSGTVIAADDGTEKITDRDTQSCPLNSGGPSLLGTRWRVKSVYGNDLPKAVNISMTVNLDTMTGSTGCNKYAAKFGQVGYTGFKITKLDKTKSPCHVFRTKPGAPAINLGDLEGGFLRTIRRMGSVQQLDDETLVFYNRNGEKALIMSKPI